MADPADIAAFHQKIKPETLWQRICLVLLCFATMSPAMQLTGFGRILPDWPLPVWLVISAMVGAFVGFTYYPQWRYGFIGFIPGMFAGPCVLLLAYVYTLSREKVFKAEMALVWVVGLAPAALAYYLLMRFAVLATSRPSSVAGSLRDPGPSTPHPSRFPISTPPEEEVPVLAESVSTMPFASQVTDANYRSQQKSIGPAIIGIALAFIVVLIGGVVVLTVFSGRAPRPIVQPPAGAVPGMAPQPGGPIPPVAQNKQLSRDDVSKLAADLQSKDTNTQRAAARQLTATEPVEEVRSQVVTTLIELLKSNDFVVRHAAAEALVQWATAESIPQLVPFLESDDFVIRRHLINTLGKLGDEKAAGPLVARLGTGADRPSAASALKSIGAPAEPAVIAALEHQDPFVRAEACRILGTIGTAKGSEALESAAKDQNGLVSMAARQALRTLSSRK